MGVRGWCHLHLPDRRRGSAVDSLPSGGAWLLLASMVGSFVFDLAYHFLIPGPDNVFTLQPGAWLIPFRVSSVMVVAVSGLGSLVGGCRPWHPELSRVMGRPPFTNCR